MTPKAVYELPAPNDETVGGYGNRRDFESECRLHASLEDIPEIARIANWGEDCVDLGGTPLDVYWTQMELVRGETVEHYFAHGNVLTPRAIAQVAEDLLTLSEKLQSQSIFHNDLHGGNAVIVSLPPEKHRRRAIDPGVAVRVFDLGSAAKDDKADLNSSRLGDLEQISLQIHRLLDRFDQSASSSAIIASDVRLSAQLRRVAQAHAQIDWESRRVTATDMLREVRRAYEMAVHPEQFRPIEFQSIQDHYNAQTLPSAFARTLIYDPDGQWTRAMTSAGPQLVVGMRGCGKTMLLRSLEWSAHAVVAPEEDRAQAVSRIAGQSYLGLFVSCAHLLRAPRERVGEGALQRLYLAYAREAIRAVQTCEVHSLGNPRPEAIDRFCELISATVPTFQPGEQSAALPRIELELSKAIQRDVPDDVRRAFVPLEAFTELAKGIRSLVDIWAAKTVLFLLDDVSKRFVNEDDLTDLLTQFCLKSETFGFKISTETQTQVLHSPSGERALEGRDYQVFHLGEHVLEALKGAAGARFLEQILDRRQQIVSGSAAVPSRKRLGNRSLRNIAESIKYSAGPGTPADRYPYYGLSALAAVCVGDIGDVLQIFHKMTFGTQPGSVISQRRQHEILVSESRLRLLSLVKLDVDNAWYFNHSAAFANASHRELAQRERLRQYSDIFVEIDSSDKAAFRSLMNLVDNGVYVIIGFRQRSKAVDGVPIYQFALRFRKLFGLNFRIPLSNRDRFELIGASVTKWLEEPRSEGLTPLPQSGIDKGKNWLRELIEDDENDEESIEPPVGDDQTQLTLFDEDFTGLLTPSPAAGLPRTALRVNIDELPIGPDTFSWQSASVIAGVGFEDRAAGSIRALNSGGIAQVDRFLLVRYADEGNADEVAAAVEALTSQVDFFDADSRIDPSDAVRDAVNSLPQGPVILDVSALTKPLIYCFTKELLSKRGQVYILHSAAHTYDPLPEELHPVMELLQEGKFPEALKHLDAITPGEGTEFVPLSVGEPWLDASLRSILVAFVTLKYRRLDSLLESIATDKIIGVRTTHSSTPKGIESRAVGLISDYLVASQNGELRSVSAMDAAATYDLLMEYYDQYVLDNAYRIELALTGTKMQTVGAAAFASVARVANVLYSVPLNRDTSRFTHGTGQTRLFELSTRLAH
ncbi:hypothetical protein LFT44_04810 [Arthrobacter sp. FW306-05-C]|uniref:ORC-CDC6 family AAA ATPase n=1 Tax=Arthrobacter sp. FW306-05-C TaxID=2879620 RepID=UPI001F2B93BD|nr:hypothetical protein [Arthrobacter sp. FW306-05-C]UKA67740.1 hypothetical protein LFT44_04810 [Arthrobacter sp. FW306-05-C]